MPPDPDQARATHQQAAATPPETRYQRIGREQRERQERRAVLMARRHRSPHKPRRSPHSSAEQRNADRIDGYDRDDLGLSPDF